MKTRGTVFPGWLNALILFSMIAGGIIVSCKTTEPPAGTTRSESAAASSVDGPAGELTGEAEEEQPVKAAVELGSTTEALTGEDSPATAAAASS